MTHKAKVQKNIAKRRSHGLYTENEKRSLSKEIRKIEKLNPETLTDTFEEVKLSIAALRNYLNTATDADLAKSPGRLMWLIQNVTMFKRQYWEMTHAPKFSLTLDQVEFLFRRIRAIIIEHVKDPQQVRLIAGDIQHLGAEVKEDGVKK